MPSSSKGGCHVVQLAIQYPEITCGCFGHNFKTMCSSMLIPSITRNLEVAECQEVRGAACPRSYCEGGRRSEFSNSNRCALGWRDRFSSSRSSDPSPSRRERLCFRDRRFSGRRHRTEGSTSTPPLTISGNKKKKKRTRRRPARRRLERPRRRRRSRKPWRRNG